LSASDFLPRLGPLSFPHVAQLASETGLTEEAVRRSLQDLVARGYLSIHDEDGRVIFQLHIPPLGGVS